MRDFTGAQAEPPGTSTPATALTAAIRGRGQNTGRRPVADAPVTSKTLGWVPTAGSSPVYSTASSRSWQQPPAGIILIYIIHSYPNGPGMSASWGSGHPLPPPWGRGPILSTAGDLTIDNTINTHERSLSTYYEPGTEHSACGDFSH